MTPKQWIFVSISVVCCLTACKEKPAPKPIKKAASHAMNEPVTSVTGTWTGLFEHDREEMVLDKATGDSISASSNKITLFIDQLEDGNIKGYSVCAGNDRPFTGSYEEDDERIKATLQEPGDHKNDGIFELVISKTNRTLSGKWTPYNKAKGGRHYTLTRKNFKYNATLGNHPETSMRLLTAEDVNNLYKDELRYMRNEIYARHGYSFKLSDVRQMFEGFDWYMPVSTDVRKKLSSVEVKNEKLIKNFEKYAEESYDDFGR
jgi:hypothetical protein